MNGSFVDSCKIKSFFVLLTKVTGILRYCSKRRLAYQAQHSTHQPVRHKSTQTIPSGSWMVKKPAIFDPLPNRIGTMVKPVAGDPNTIGGKIVVA